MRAWWMVILIAGCRIDFDPVAASDGGAGDARPTDAQLTDAAPGDAIAVACPATYLPLYAGSRYRAVDESVTWLVAQARCEAEGQHLVIFDSASELAAVASIAAGDDIWVGVTDRVTLGTWRTVTGAGAGYLPWQNSEPDLTAAERCIEAESPTYSYLDQDCASGRRYICECDGAATDPTSY